MAHDPTWRPEHELPHPALKAILLCDRTIQEAGTNRITLVGVLDRLTASDFPTEYARGLALYVRVIDAAGQYPIRMEIVRLEDEETVARATR